MYIKVRRLAEHVYDYQVYTANHRVVLTAETGWHYESSAKRAAKKMAKRLSIGYKESKK